MYINSMVYRLAMLFKQSIMMTPTQINTEIMRLEEQLRELNRRCNTDKSVCKNIRSITTEIGRLRLLLNE